MASNEINTKIDSSGEVDNFILSIPVHIENINKPISVYELVLDAFENNRVKDILAKNEVLREYWDNDDDLKELDESYYDLYINIINTKLRLHFKKIADENNEDDNTFSITDTKLEGSLGVSFTLSATIFVNLVFFKYSVLNYVKNVSQKLKIESIYYYSESAITLQVDNSLVFNIFRCYSLNIVDELELHGYDYRRGLVKINSYIDYNAIEDTIELSMTITDDCAGHYDEDWAEDLLKDIPESLAIKSKRTNGYNEVELIIDTGAITKIDMIKSSIVKYLGKNIINTWKDYVQSRTRLQELISSKNESNLDRSEL